jgi:hypothetical protein
MSQVLPFPSRRPFPLRRSPALRLVAVLILIFFAAAVVWTTVITMGGYSLTSDSYAPLPHPSH